MNMIKNGVLPLTPDRRDRDFHKTFGAVTVFHDSYNTNFNPDLPDQNADGLPYGCTGYTQAEICGDEDKKLYDPLYTYDKGRLVDGTEGQEVGVQLKTSLKTTIVYGVQEKGENNADNNRRGAYYNVTATSDYFDGARSAMQKYSNLWGKPCSLSIASRWCLNFSSTGKTGIVKMPTAEQYSIYSLHNWKVNGWETIDGVPYLICKSWQGKNVGDGGWLYFSREIYNKLIDDYFAGAFVLAPFTGNWMSVKLTTLEVIVGMLARAGYSAERLGKIAMQIQHAFFGKGIHHA